MEKDAAVQALCQKGYQAYNDKGVVMIRLPSYSTSIEKAIRNYLQEIGYHCSFGIIGTKNGKTEPIATSDVDVSEEIFISPTENTLSLFTDTEDQLTFQW